MITDKTLDEAMVEAARFLKAAKTLRSRRKVLLAQGDATYANGGKLYYFGGGTENAAVERAALDLRYKLADLRAGR